MTISKVNASGWSFGEKLTSTQINSFDTKLITALDKTSAGDTLAGIIALSGVGRLTDTCVDAADADTTYSVGGSRCIRLTSSVTADRTYTLNGTGAQTNDTVTFYCDPGFTKVASIVDSGSATVLAKLSYSDVTGGHQAVTMVYKGGAWKVQSASRPTGFRVSSFTSNGTWTCPPGVYRVLLVGCGGGGGGGGGRTGSTTTSQYPNGGGGGGGAQMQFAIMSTTPATAYTVTIGAGGAGGTGGTTATNGSPGGDTSVSGGGPTFKGGGAGYVRNTLNNTVAAHPIGGAPLNTMAFDASYVATDNEIAYPAGNGGYGGTSGNGATGVGNWQYDGASGGAGGATVSSYEGGGGGGGGGAGAFGAGAAGGAGGDGDTLVATNGTNGTSASANTGAGGGGGGGGGSAASAGAGGNGGNGGSGRLYVIWV